MNKCKKIEAFLEHPDHILSLTLAIKNVNLFTDLRNGVIMNANGLDTTDNQNGIRLQVFLLFV